MALKQDLIETLEKISDILEFKEENPFKVNAFRNGANILRNLDGNIESKIIDNSIKDLKGIGKGLLSVIYDFYQYGKSSDLENLSNDIPDGIMDLLKIRGLGVKKVKAIYNQLKISNIGDLEKACKSNQISSLKGFGQKIQETILKEIEKIAVANNYLLLNEAEYCINEITSELKNFKSITQFIPTGEYHRSLEVISKLEFVIQVSDFKEFNKQLNKEYAQNISIGYKEIFSFIEIDLANSKVFKISYKFTIPTFFYVTSDEDEFIQLLFLTTGSQQFLNLLKLKNIPAAKSEKEIFKKSGIDFIIPEMREEQFIKLSENKKNNSDLDIEKFKGFFHFHTNYSDGRNTLSEMVKSLKQKGYRYLAVCDHSKSAFYANGLNEERILEQKKEVSKVSIEYNIPIFQGIESDILKDGELDYSDDFMKNFDFVVASVHSRFQMEENEMTKRIIKAIENPNTDVLGHPTGRLLLKRDAYKININKIIDACAANNVAIEINAHPQRLDLDWRNIYYAREKECLFSINPDAHSIDEIDLIRYGIMVARKGGVLVEEVINCLDKDNFISFINRKINRKNRNN